MTDSTQAIFNEASEIDIDIDEAFLIDVGCCRLDLEDGVDGDCVAEKVHKITTNLFDPVDDVPTLSKSASIGCRMVGFLMIVHDLRELASDIPEALTLRTRLLSVVNGIQQLDIAPQVYVIDEMAKTIAKAEEYSPEGTPEGNILFNLLDKAAAGVVASQSPNQEALANRLFDATYGTSYPDGKDKGVLDVLDDLFPVLGIDRQMQRLEDIRANAVAFEDSHIDYFPVLKTIGYQSLEELFEEPDAATKFRLTSLYGGGQAPVAAAPAAP